MIATVLNHEHADVIIRLAPGGPSGVPVSRFGARDEERRRHGRTDGTTLDADQVFVETTHGGKPAPPSVPRRSEFELDMITAPGFMSEWAFESGAG